MAGKFANQYRLHIRNGN
ncbi:hypothetical protein YPPY89_3226, partial [Yersinia pestis PY-89]